MTVKSVMLALPLVLCSVLMFLFVDSLQAVGRYDAGIKWLVLQLPYASMLMLFCAIPFLRRARVALMIVVLSFLLFLPLFVHECLPGLVALFDPAYRSAYGDGGSVPFLRYDPLGFGAFALLVCVLVILLIRRRKPERWGRDN